MKKINKNLGYKYLALGLLLLSANLTMLAFDAAEIDALKPAQRRLRKLSNETAKAVLDAKDKFTRDDLRELTKLREEIDYIMSLDELATASAVSPDGSRSESGSDGDGEYRLRAEDRARLEGISSKIKLSQERSKLEKALREEQAKPDRSRDMRLISKLQAEIDYIDVLKSAASRDVYGAKAR